MMREEWLQMQAEHADLSQRLRAESEARTPPAYRELVSRLERIFDQVRAGVSR